MNFLEAARRIGSLIFHPSPEVIADINVYILIFMFTGISFVYYCDMIYLTLDRLLDIVLNIRYRLFWNEMRARMLLLATWILGICLSVTISLLCYFINFNWEDAFFTYFYPTLEFSFIVLAFVTYSFIFHKYKQTRGAPKVVGSRYNTRRRGSTVETFRNSRFYISVLIILTFLVFMVVPDLTYFFVGVIYGNTSDTLAVCCWISYAVSNLLDAWIYIFLQPSVRRLMWKKLGLTKSRRTSEVLPRRALIIMQAIQGRSIGRKLSKQVKKMNRDR